MLKGTPIKERNRTWHIEHMARMKRRKAHRKKLLLASRKSIRRSRELSKKYNTEEAENRRLLEKEVERGKLYWLFFRWRGRINAFFNKVANQIRKVFKKTDATKVKA